MYHVAWLAKRDPFYDRKVFADICAKGGAPSVYSMVAWEIDYLQVLFPDAQWHWVDDAREIAPLMPDVVVFSSNDFDLAGVLNTWVPKILVQLSDEWGRSPMCHKLTESVPLVLRQYRFKHYYRPDNVRHIPLGFMACMFGDPKAIALPDPLAERSFKWSFVGNINRDREVAVTAFSRWWLNWQGPCTPSQMRNVYMNSQFVLCPRGNVGMDCFRNYEATVCGAIPVVAGCSKEEYIETFCELGNPPWVFAETWGVALAICKSLVETGTLVERRKQNLLWWSNEMQSLQIAIRASLDGGIYRGKGEIP
jgi:hypothetical protein